jgi:hypothetical protein
MEFTTSKMNMNVKNEDIDLGLPEAIIRYD